MTHQPASAWDDAVAIAAASPNKVRQVGAVITFRDGSRLAACNTFPAGIQDLPERHEGDGRFVWMEHAERNAILQAARHGKATSEAEITTTYFPCIDCARAIVVAGFSCVETPAPDPADPVWGPSTQRAETILREGGVAIRVRPRG